MKISRPSPALVLSIISIVIACAGTATAAGVLIKNSSQVKAGAISGSDIAKNAVTSRNIKDGAVDTGDLSTKVKSALTSQGFTATEASRRSGPNKVPAGTHDIATLTQLAPGTYAIFAATTVTPEVGNNGLGELLRQVRTVSASCVLSAGGDEAHATQAVASPYSQAPATINMQMTRSIAQPTDVKISCTVNDYPWNAADTSIIALKLSGSTRTDVTQ